MRGVALFNLAFFTTAVPAAAFPAGVSSCHDGGTCPLEAGQESVKVRLTEIDAPEIDQLFATQARDTLCAMICGRIIEVEPRGTSYDRFVGFVRIQSVTTIEAMDGAGARGTMHGTTESPRSRRSWHRRG